MRSGKAGAGGFTYLGVLFAVAIMGTALAGMGELYSTSMRREREADLLWIGSQYADAFLCFSKNHGGQYPNEIEELLSDARSGSAGMGALVVRHCIRKLYADPMTQRNDWKLLRNDAGRIVGVASTYDGKPFRKANFPKRWEHFADKEKYSDWEFSATPPKKKADGTSEDGSTQTTPPPATGTTNPTTRGRFSEIGRGTSTSRER